MSNRKWIRIIAWVLPALVLLVLFTRQGKPPARPPGSRTEQVRIVDWNAIDASVREVFIKAGDRARSHAEAQVRNWGVELKRRAEDEFLPWYFGYWNQQALSLKTAGWTVLDTPFVRNMTGSTRSATERLEELIEQEFNVRVLHPVSATRRVEAITRESVKIYLQTLNEGLHAIETDYQLRDPQWTRYLEGLPGMIRAVEGNRQVPLLIKATTTGGGAVAMSVTQMVSNQIRMMLYRRGQRELMEHSIRATGGVAIKGLGGLAMAAFMSWDLYDHHRTVQQNLPVLRRLLHDYFEQLEQLVLHDPQTGIMLTLDQTANQMIESLPPSSRITRTGGSPMKEEVTP